MRKAARALRSGQQRGCDASLERGSLPIPAVTSIRVRRSVFGGGVHLARLTEFVCAAQFDRLKPDPGVFVALIGRFPIPPGGSLEFFLVPSPFRYINARKYWADA